MIRRVSDALPPLAKQDVYGTRTIGYHNTYGTEQNDVAFYAQESGGRSTAVLSDAFGHGALTVADGADMDELRSFVCFSGLETLLCAREIAQTLRFPTESIGSVMCYYGAESKEDIAYLDSFDPEFSYRDVYALLEQCGFSLGGYDAWFGDLALRVRRGTAEIRCFVRGGTLASTASVLFRSENALYLGAVATDPAFRGGGLAGALVRSFAQDGKRVEILCGAHRVSFYTSLGFRQNGEFAICRFFK